MEEYSRVRSPMILRISSVLSRSSRRRPSKVCLYSRSDNNKLTSCLVLKARQSSGSRCHIVTFDWVEDCLLGPKNSKRLLKERAYTLDRTVYNLERGIKVDKADLRKRFDENARIAHELSTSSTYHLILYVVVNRAVF